MEIILQHALRVLSLQEGKLELFNFFLSFSFLPSGEIDRFGDDYSIISEFFSSTLQ